MSITIGSNIASLRAQRSLDRSTAQQSAIAERLASGLRINRASDDAAGLALAASLTTESRLFGQAGRNLSDGVSYLSIMDGAASQLTTILDRAKELATQAANGTYSLRQRAALDVELQAIMDEYNRIIDTTTFNDINVFSTDRGPLVLQVGPNSTETLSIEFRPPAPDYVNGTGAASVTTAGVTGNGSSDSVSLSQDGRYVLFESLSSNLVTGDANGQRDIFLRDLLTGTTQIVSTTSSGAPANGPSRDASISANGRYVTFRSDATNLVAGDTNGAKDVFRKDLLTGTVVRVSTATGGTQSNSDSYDPNVSTDGRFVTYFSDATNLVSGDTNGVTDVFLTDVETGTTTLLSSSSAGVVGNGNSFDPVVSADGRFVAFHSTSTNLVAGDSNGKADVFVKDTVLGTITRISVDDSGAQGNNDSFSASISGDGRYIAFRSGASNLVAGDTNGQYDVFVRDTVSGTTKRINVTPSGTQANNSSYEPSISADGRFVAYGSGASNLTSGDTNGQDDIFVYDQTNGTTIRIKATNGSEGNGSSSTAVISGDGRFVAFLGDSTNFATGDANGATDIFVSNVLPDDTAVAKLRGLSVATRPQALLALDTLDAHYAGLGGTRGAIGSFLSRVAVAQSNIQTRNEGVTAAASRIQDADIAAEAAEYTRLKILQQVGAAVLAQANLQPSIALKLLGP